MSRYRALSLILITILLLAPVTVRADINDPLVIQGDVFVTAGSPEKEWPTGLIVQATSGTNQDGYWYVLTTANVSPYTVPTMRILDRYLPDDPDQVEIAHEWLAGKLEPEQAVSWVLKFPEGPLPNGCHQLEIRLADNLDTILMDCSVPGSTTVWNIPLTEEMSEYLAQPPLTLAQPQPGSKLGLHVTSNHTPAILEFVRDAHPAVIVAVADLGWLADVKAVSPGTLTLGRFLQVDQTIEGDPVVRAREFVAEHADRYAIFPGVDYWLGWNEPIVKTEAEMAWYAAFEAERAVAMAELGLRVAVGNFSAGNPEPGLWNGFLPAIAAAKQHGGLLALHEYSAPSMRDGVGSEVPGLETNSNNGALTLRYRYLYEQLLRVHDLVVPLVISEAGIDGGVLKTSEGPMGWRDFAEVNNQSEDEAAASYVEQLSWYDEQVRLDPYVIGFAVFNVGDTQNKWKSFDITDILPLLADMRNSKN